MDESEGVEGVHDEANLMLGGKDAVDRVEGPVRSPRLQVCPHWELR